MFHVGQGGEGGENGKARCSAPFRSPPRKAGKSRRQVGLSRTGHRCSIPVSCIQRSSTFPTPFLATGRFVLNSSGRGGRAGRGAWVEEGVCARAGGGAWAGETGGVHRRRSGANGESSGWVDKTNPQPPHDLRHLLGLSRPLSLPSLTC